MQPFNPWAWRDPSALAGGYDQTSPEEVPRQRTEHDGGPDAPGPGTPIDLTGYRVEATDGRIGSIDAASEDAGARYLVVDTGPWIFGRKVLLPVGTVARVDHLDRIVHVDRTRDQVKESPAFDPDDFDRPEYRDRVGSYYAESYRRD
ncbi:MULTISPECIES: PRC-barrel domain-containing protein [Micromonospora]|uniref:PRC-barrel domain containing protein n=1 Tax=Micromonospora solifontis TaxID=2487138 RepID=A0ABX9WAQ9_9ACTN|nr:MULTISPECIES: PRC-barrel domain-containing protein [Micromonospora]NES16865.1 PRC-barrel domain containing protein [Micromonospora sp. PPF5-17B]NES39198.1 PRC-barrel domain containing protein [Micromonospora solifontis]NES58937.1 PRC-barrel domain containing protein [Micromonospora sp. PPF5-6]RNL90345.1 PRC-barrel domain containing protein [Micromonospora solifontis]